MATSTATSTAVRVCASPFPTWAPLLVACADHAKQSGWRFQSFEFDAQRIAEAPAETRRARLKALPAIRRYAALCAAAARARPKRASRPAAALDGSDGLVDGGEHGEHNGLNVDTDADESNSDTTNINDNITDNITEHITAIDGANTAAIDAELLPSLLVEFRQCQRLIAQDAAFHMMERTCEALCVLDDPTLDAMASPLDQSDCAYQDVSLPLPLIALRLRNHANHFEANAEAAAEYKSRLYQATFIVDFGEACGGHLKEIRDETSLMQLNEFWTRVAEWGGHDEAAREIVAALTGSGDSINDGANGGANAKHPLCDSAPASGLSLSMFERRISDLAALAASVRVRMAAPAASMVSQVGEAVDEEVDSIVADSMDAARAVVGSVRHAGSQFLRAVQPARARAMRAAAAFRRASSADADGEAKVASESRISRRNRGSFPTDDELPPLAPLYEPALPGASGGLLIDLDP